MYVCVLAVFARGIRSQWPLVFPKNLAESGVFIHQVCDVQNVPLVLESSMNSRKTINKTAHKHTLNIFIYIYKKLYTQEANIASFFTADLPCLGAALELVILYP